MCVDLVVKNAKVVTPRATVCEACIAVKEGRIVGMMKEAHMPKAGEVIDAGGKIAIPGVIDAHVHFWDPGYTHREDWETGTKSAAAGGVTTVIDMPSTNKPPITTVELFNGKRETAERKAIVDFALHAAVTPDNLFEIGRLFKAGAASIKFFMAEKVRELERIDDGLLFDAFREINRARGVASVHAESRTVVYLTEKIKKESSGPEAHALARPNFVEAEAVFSAIALAANAGAKLHICHMSSEEGVSLVRSAKTSGQDLSAETCPHYLLFTREDVKKFGPYLKIGPPLKSAKDRDALWRAVQDGTVDVVATDHCPFLKSEKEVGWENIWEAGTGVPGTETLLSIMLSEGVNKNRISLERLVEVLSESPARIFGLYPRKGAIKVGSDADIVLLDMKKQDTIKIEKLHTKGEFTPYEGMEVRGVPVLTLIRGRKVMEDGQIMERQGIGRFVAREISP